MVRRVPEAAEALSITINAAEAAVREVTTTSIRIGRVLQGPDPDLSGCHGPHPTPPTDLRMEI